MQTYLLQQYGEIWNESKDITVSYGSCRYWCNIKYLYTYQFGRCQGRIGQDFQTGTEHIRDVKIGNFLDKKDFSKIVNLRHFTKILLNLKDKIYEFMPSYARKRENVFYRKNAYKWRKIKENQHFQGVSYK